MMLSPLFSEARPKTHVIGFYNLENLFDTYHDEGKNDYEYLPDGANEWTEAKYQKKLGNMAHVIAEMKRDNGMWHTVLGVSEIENRHVLEDLVNEPEIAEANFQIVHYDGPDRRGVDVGLLYDPSRMTLVESESIPYTFDSDIDFGMTVEEQDAFRTRDILMVHGIIDGEHFAFYVCHLPSRLGEKSGALRARGGEIAYNHFRQVAQKYPGIKCVVMGDMNDNPTDDSMAVYLRGRERIEVRTIFSLRSCPCSRPATVRYTTGVKATSMTASWSVTAWCIRSPVPSESFQSPRRNTTPASSPSRS